MVLKLFKRQKYGKVEKLDKMITVTNFIII